MKTRPEIQATDREAFAATHQAPIIADFDTVFSFDSIHAGESIFLDIDHIFTDADGTVVSEGTTVLDSDKARLIRDLYRQGIGTTIITGKPYAEVEKLHKSLPAGLQIRFIYEKGAYVLQFSEDGRPIQRHLLSSESLEQSVLVLKQEFTDFIATLIRKHDTEGAGANLGFGWAGSGAHRSIISIDIFSRTPPENYIELIGSDREALKLTDKTRLSAIVDDISTFVRERQPTWSVIHLGNGNIDITPHAIEKDTAIAADEEFKEARRVLVLGDTENDRAMFRMRQRFGEKVVAGLVYHRREAVALLEDVDVVSVGMANADPILAAVLSVRAEA